MKTFNVLVVLLIIVGCTTESDTENALDNLQYATAHLQYSKDKFGICYAGYGAGFASVFTTVPCEAVGL